MVSVSAVAGENAPPKFTKELTQLSNPALESLVALADQVTSKPDLGNCEHFVYRERMLLPPNINYDAALNEFMSRIQPGDRAYNFGSLGLRSASDNSIAKLAGEGTSPETKAAVEQLNAQVGAALNSAVVLMSGTAVYSAANTPDAEMTVRAIIDTEAGEFLMFGVGKCE